MKNKSSLSPYVRMYNLTSSYMLSVSCDLLEKREEKKRRKSMKPLFIYLFFTYRWDNYMHYFHLLFFSLIIYLREFSKSAHRNVYKIIKY